MSLSSHVGEKGVSGGASVAVGGVDDIRQPSVDGLHSPSSPNAPVAVAKQGMYVCMSQRYCIARNFAWCKVVADRLTATKNKNHEISFIVD